MAERREKKNINRLPIEKALLWGVECIRMKANHPPKRQTTAKTTRRNAFAFVWALRRNDFATHRKRVRGAFRCGFSRANTRGSGRWVCCPPASPGWWLYSNFAHVLTACHRNRSWPTGGDGLRCLPVLLLRRVDMIDAIFMLRRGSICFFPIAHTQTIGPVFGHLSHRRRWVIIGSIGTSPVAEGKLRQIELRVLVSIFTSSSENRHAIAFEAYYLNKVLEYEQKKARGSVFLLFLCYAVWMVELCYCLKGCLFLLWVHILDHLFRCTFKTTTLGRLGRPIFYSFRYALLHNKRHVVSTQMINNYQDCMCIWYAKLL